MCVMDISKKNMLKRIKEVYENGGNIMEYLRSGNGNSVEDILISYDFQAGTYEEEYYTKQDFVKESCESAKVKYTSGNNFTVLKGNDSDQFIGFCRESYLAGSMMLLGMQFPFLRARRVKVVMFPKENK